MSLANTILFESAERVNAMLQMGEDPNAIDEYGFTPLIEAAIVSKIDTTLVLLNAGADPNGQDLAGRTPLHWATQNNHLELADLLLKRGAKPNAITTGSEPVLASPLLRHQEKMKTRLYQAGADLNFAKDYINTKLLGHRYELIGHSYIYSPEKKFVLVDLEGFILEFSLNMLKESLKRFKRNYAARHLQMLKEKQSAIIASFENAAELIRYQQYTVNKDEYRDRIQALFKEPVLIIPATYQGHAICFVKCGQYFAKIDRGQNSETEGTVILYQMTKPQGFTAELLHTLFYVKQDDAFMHKELNQLLGLRRLMNIPVSPQLTGNCSWANTEAAIPTLCFLLLIHDPVYQNDMPQALRLALEFYEEWHEWDKDRALDECLQDFETDSKERRAAKASLLAALLFQTCHYTDIAHINRAERILTILQQKEFIPFMRNYVKTYYQDRPTPPGQNLMHLFDLINMHRDHR